MAVIKLHLANLAAVDHKRRYQLSDAAATRILDAHRDGAETDEAVWTRLADAFVEKLLSEGHAKRKSVLAAAALAGIVKDTAPGEADV